MIKQVVHFNMFVPSSLYFLLLFFLSISGDKFFLVLAIITCLLYMPQIRWRIEYILFVVLVSIAILIISFFWNALFYQPLFFFLVSCLSGLYLYQNPPSKFSGLLVFSIVTLYFAFHLLNQSNLNEDVFFAKSRNFISVWMIAASIFCYSSSLNRNVMALVFFTSFLISCFTLSRSGMISTFFIFLSYFLLSNSRNKARESFYVVLLGVALFAYFFEDIRVIFELIYNRFEGARAVDPRQLVINCYVDNFTLERAFLGLNAFDGQYCGTLAIGEYAPHNSLISLYTNLGVLSFLYLAIALFIRSPISLKFIFIGLLIRSLTDSVLFFTFFDFIYVYLLLKMYHSKDVR